MKIFITSKIYDTDAKPITDIEKEVQNDLDNYVGKDRVIFKLYIMDKTAVMCFYRCVDYSSLHANPVDMIIDADAYMITGEGYEGFMMQCPFYKIPYDYSYSMEQSEFLKAYKKSGVLLGGDKIKMAKLEIDEKKIVLRVETK